MSTNTNTSKYGFMFMSQAGESYKNVSTQSAFWTKLQELLNDLSQEQNKVWGDPENGMVKAYLAAAIDGANSAGDSIRQDAVNAIIGAAVGTVSLAGTIGMHFKTSDKALDMKIKNADEMKNILTKKSEVGLIMEEKPTAGSAPEAKVAAKAKADMAQKEYDDLKYQADQAAEQSQKNPDNPNIKVKVEANQKAAEAAKSKMEQANAEVRELEKKASAGNAQKTNNAEEETFIKEKIQSWLRGDKDAFESFKQTTTKGTPQEREKAVKENEWNLKAVEQAKAHPDAEKIRSNLDHYAQNIRSEKSKLEQQFQQFTQTTFQFMPSLQKAGEVRQDYIKADETTHSQIQQAIAQILMDVEKKQAQAAEENRQRAAQFGDEAKSAANSLGQIQQAKSNQ